MVAMGTVHLASRSTLTSFCSIFLAIGCVYVCASLGMQAYVHLHACAHGGQKETLKCHSSGIVYLVSGDKVSMLTFLFPCLYFVLFVNLT